MKSKEEKKDKEQKTKVNLNETLAAINKMYGEGTITMGGKIDLRIERVEGGVIALDLGIGGGIPRGSIIEYYGRESAGKTAACLKHVASYQKKGLICAWVDMEHNLDYKWAKTLGVDPDKMLISQPDTAEKSIDIVDTLIRSGKVDLIVYDSVAAALPVEEEEKSAGDWQMGLQARLFSKASRKWLSALQPDNIEDEKANNLTTIILINQVREKIGIHARGYQTPAGHALKHSARIRVQLNRTDYIKEKGCLDPIGIEVTFKVVKNKTWVPGKVGSFKLYFDGHIDNSDTVIAEAVKYGFIQRHGPMYTYGEIYEKGKEKFMEKLEEENKYREVIEKIYKEIKCKG